MTPTTAIDDHPDFAEVLAGHLSQLAGDYVGPGQIGNTPVLIFNSIGKVNTVWHRRADKSYKHGEFTLSIDEVERILFGSERELDSYFYFRVPAFKDGWQLELGLLVDLGRLRDIIGGDRAKLPALSTNHKTQERFYKFDTKLDLYAHCIISLFNTLKPAENVVPLRPAMEIPAPPIPLPVTEGFDLYPFQKGATEVLSRETCWLTAAEVMNLPFHNTTLLKFFNYKDTSVQGSLTELAKKHPDIERRDVRLKPKTRVVRQFRFVRNG